MKHLLFTLLLIPFGIFSSCDKDCPADENQTCQETVPNEACTAAFQRWFYDADDNKCEQISYSGCAAYGFATKEECEECKCDD